MTYIGREAQLQGAYDKVDDISSQFNGTLDTFDIKVNTVNKMIGKTTNLIVGLNRALQEPNDDYQISNHQIIFTVAPANGVKCSITILGDVFKAPTTGNTDLNSLTDVVVGSENDNEVLTYSGGSWINLPQGTTHLSNNSDVDTSSAVNGDKLVFDGIEWSGEHDLLNNINNVNAPSPSDNQTLTWNDTAGEWQPMDAQSTVSNIDDLDDVDTVTSAPSLNNVLTWDGSNWVPQTTQSVVNSMDDLNDADTSTVPPIDGQALVWNASVSNWNPGTVSGGGGASAIDDLSDVDTVTSAPSSGQSLVWDGSNWVPGTVSGGGGASTGDIQIYIANTGDDTTGDGSSGSPYRTINRAIDHANNIITTNGIIYIKMVDDNINYMGSSTVTINHPNKIICMSVTGDTYNLESSTLDVLFNIVNSNITFEQCKFEIVDESVFNLTSGNNSITLKECSGSFKYFCTQALTQFGYNDNNRLSIHESSFMPMNTTTFLNFGYLDFQNVTFDGNNMTLNIPYIYTKKCNIHNFNVIIKNPPQNSKSVFKFYYSNIFNVNIDLDDPYTEHSSFNDGLCYFDGCNINDITFTLHYNTASVISFNSCNVNDLYYVNNSNLTGNNGDGQLIEARGGSNISINTLDRDPNSDDFTGTYILKASARSFISVSNINNYGEEGDFTTAPTYRHPGDNFVFDGSNSGGCIYINNVYNEDDGGGEE